MDRGGAQVSYISLAVKLTCLHYIFAIVIVNENWLCIKLFETELIVTSLVLFLCCFCLNRVVEFAVLLR